MKPQLESLEDRVLPTIMQPLPIAQEITSLVQLVETQAASLMQPLVVQAAQNATASYSPQQIRQAYGFNNTGAVGAGQTIAIVDAYDDPAIYHDLAVFDAQYNLPMPAFGVLNLGAAPDPTGSWELEESLDVEWAHAMAPGATIVLVEAPTSKDLDLFTAVRIAASLPTVSVVSMSWGNLIETPSDPQWNSVFSTPPFHNPVAFVAAAGDESGWDPTYPGTSPYVLDVGGTTLNLNADNSIQSETAWFRGGGGVSPYEPKPGFQNSLPYSHRAAPDVSFVGDPATGVEIYDTFEGGFVRVGGTSVGAPCWSAIIADADQTRANAGQASLDNSTLADIIYSHPSDLNDITKGNNAAFQAGPGFDLATGWGTPIVPSLMNDLAGHSGGEQPPSLFAETEQLLLEDRAFIYYSDLAAQNPAYISQAERALALIQGNPFAHTPQGEAVQAWVASQFG